MLYYYNVYNIYFYIYIYVSAVYAQVYVYIYLQKTTIYNTICLNATAKTSLAK